MSDTGYSRARLVRDWSARCARYVSFSALKRTLRQVGSCETSSHPPRTRVLASALARMRNLRRLWRSLGIGRTLVFHRIVAGDHRSQIVEHPGQQHHDDVDEREGDQKEGRDEVDRPRGLASAE